VASSTCVLALALLALSASACTSKPRAKTEEDLRRELKGLPYLGSVPLSPAGSKKRGLVINDRTRRYDGYRYFTLYTRAEGYLIDADGALLHTWKSPALQSDDALVRMSPFMSGWQQAELTASGHLLALISRGGIVDLDWDSRVVWQAEMLAHHELFVASNGEIETLIDAFRMVEADDRRVLIIDNQVVRLASDGKEGQRVSIYDALMAHPEWRGRLQKIVAALPVVDADHLPPIEVPISHPAYAALAEARRPERVAALKSLIATGKAPIPGREAIALLRYANVRENPFDIFHSNTARWLPEHPKGLWKEGSILVSIRNLDLLMVVDPSQYGKIVWWWGPGEIERQHEPSILANGNILLFDNGSERGWSRVIEVDPSTKQIVWQYGDGKGTRFFSFAEGGVQMLPNGNTLIAISNEGRTIEITRDGVVVWEFYMPLQSRNRRFIAYRFHALDKSASAAIQEKYLSPNRPQP